MVRLKTRSSNEVLTTEVLVANDNVTSWVWLTPMLGARRVGLFVSDTASWSIYGGWREAAIKVIGFRKLMSATHSIGTKDWSYTLFLKQGRGNFVSDIVIKFSSARPGLPILGVEIGRHSKMSKDLLSHRKIKEFSVSYFCHYDAVGGKRPPCILIFNIKEAGSVR